MKIVTVDDKRRVRLAGSAPNSKFWLVQDGLGYRLFPIAQPQPKKRLSKKEALKLIDQHPVVLTAGWDEIRKTTREIDCTLNKARHR
jgi:hypothetical protein